MVTLSFRQPYFCSLSVYNQTENVPENLHIKTRLDD